MRAALIKIFGEPTEVLELPTCRSLPDRLRAVLHAQRGGKVLLDIRGTT